MSLTSYPFVFYDNEKDLLDKWGDIFESCKGKDINKIYGVWDELSCEWFDDAPMLVEFSHGILAITVKSERYVALEWNIFSPSDKPVWFDDEQIRELPGLNWEENLNWREYDRLSECFEKNVESILPFKEKQTILGILIKFKNAEDIVIGDAGDVILGVKAIDWK